jgi:predicted transcriptional regulator
MEIVNWNENKINQLVLSMSNKLTKSSRIHLSINSTYPHTTKLIKLLVKEGYIQKNDELKSGRPNIKLTKKGLKCQGLLQELNNLNNMGKDYEKD